MEHPVKISLDKSFWRIQVVLLDAFAMMWLYVFVSRRLRCDLPMTRYSSPDSHQKVAAYRLIQSGALTERNPLHESSP